jgi:hypothetical protein
MGPYLMLRRALTSFPWPTNLSPLFKSVGGAGNEFHPPNANMQPTLPLTRKDGMVGYNDFPRVQKQPVPRVHGNTYYGNNVEG